MRKLLFLSLVGIDQSTKYKARKQQLPELNESNYVQFHPIENKGIAGSLFSNYTILPLVLNALGVIITILKRGFWHNGGSLELAFGYKIKCK